MADDSTPRFPPDPIPRIIPGGGITILGGAAGTGKTALVASWARAWRDGTTICGHQVHKGQLVVYLTADRSWPKSGLLWFTAAGFPEIVHYSLQDDLTYPISRLRARDKLITEVLAHCLAQLDKAYGGRLPWGTLVIVDPLSLFLGGNLNDYFSCAVACAEIRHICNLRGITIFGLGHSAKQRASAADRYLRPQDRLAGSMAQIGYTDTLMYLASPEETDDALYLLYIAPHHAPPETFLLQRGTDGLFLPAGPGDGNLRDLLGHLAALVPQHITMPAKDLLEAAAAAGLGSRRSINRYLVDLVRMGLLEKPARGVYRRVKTH